MSENKEIGNANNDKKQNTVIIQRCFKLLEYFRQNTDSEHTVTQYKMREDEIDEYMGNKTSFNKMIKNMAIALNFDDDGCLKPSSDRKLLFRDFSMMYDEYEELTDVSTVSIPIKDIYYNHEFTQREVQDIIIALRTSGFINAEYAEKLIDKIKTELASKHFCDRFKEIIDNREHIVSEKLVDNLSVIKNALINNNRLTFSMNYYNDKNQLITYGKRLTISPYFIILDNGKYYVVGCFENENNETKNLAIIRIDLMSNIRILKIRVTSMYDIPSLRQIYGDKFRIEDKFRTYHLNMSYNDDYLCVEMKIRKTPKTNNEVNYTFIHDSFGNQYTVLKKEADGDIVRVRCSKYSIVNWAVQYGDFVKVISPDSVIEEIKKKIETLKSKYFEEEKNYDTE